MWGEFLDLWSQRIVEKQDYFPGSRDDNRPTTFLNLVHAKENL
jgi:hypothetical protein